MRRRERPRRLSSPGGLSSGGLCTDQDRLTVRAKWSKEGETSNSSFDGKLFRRLRLRRATKPRELLQQPGPASFNEVAAAAAAAAGWQISRIKVGKRSRGQMERVELY